MLTTPLGLRSMRRRAEVREGSLHLDTRAGTSVELRVSLEGLRPQP